MLLYRSRRSVGRLQATGELEQVSICIQKRRLFWVDSSPEKFTPAGQREDNNRCEVVLHQRIIFLSSFRAALSYIASKPRTVYEMGSFEFIGLIILCVSVSYLIAVGSIAVAKFAEDAISLTVCAQPGASSRRISNNMMISAVISWILMAGEATGSYAGRSCSSPRLLNNGVRLKREKNWLRTSINKSRRVLSRGLASDILSISP